MRLLPAWESSQYRLGQTSSMIAHLAIVLPGRGYGALGPALRLPRLAVEEAGAETVVVEYPGDTPLAQVPEWWDDLHSSVASQVASFLSEAAPERVTFLAKSLGSVALAALPGHVALPASVDAIWLTPIFGREPIRSGAIAHAWRSLLVAGGADEFYEPEHHEAVAEALGASSLVLPGANHLLEVPGDVRATLEGFRSLTEAVMAFVGSVR